MDTGIRSMGRQLASAPPGPPLLATKLFPPRPRPDAVPRPRLLARLDAALTSPVTAIIAPAGFGKTTLLSSWLAGRRAAWLSLDPGDNDPALFAHYLVAALRRALPEIGAAVLQALAGPRPMALETVVATLINELAADGRELVLVLDDLHLITAEPIMAGLALLCEQGPPNLHLVIAGRSEPGLPLPRLRARGRLVELGASELRFMPDEAAEMLNATMGLALTPPQVSALERRTEGWAAGLQLAALALRGRPDAAALIDGFAGDQRFIFDYLSAEVLDGLPAYLREFLLATAVLDRMCAELCDALLDDGTGADGRMEGARRLPAAALLDELERRNLFLVPLDERRTWYRYHQLFADVLRERLRRSVPAGEAAELRRRAGAWLAGHGLVPEAVEQLLAAGDLEPAAALIAAHSYEMFFTGRVATVESWLAALPDELIRRRPALAAVAASAAMFAGKIAEATAFVEVGERQLDDEAPPELRAELAALRSLVLSVDERYAEAIVAGEQALAALPTASLLRPMVAAGLSFSAVIAGDLAQSEQIARDMLQSLDDSPDTIWLRVHFTTMLGIVCRLRGRLREAEAFCERAVALLDASPAPAPTGTALPALNEAAVVRYQLNDLAGAEILQRRAAGLSRHSADRSLWLPVRWVEARIAAAKGELHTAVAIIEAAAAEGRAAARQRDAAPYGTVRRAIIEAERVRLHLLRGDLAAATAAGSDLAALSLAQRLPSPYPEVSLAPLRLLLAQGDRPGAIAGLNRLLERAERNGLGALAAQALLLRAAAHRAAGDHGAARADLAAARARVEPEFFARLLADEGPAPLSAGDPEVAPASPTQHLAEPLTPRELEVLRLLAAGRSNREIAAALVVAEGTAKRHVANLCAKLAAPSRLAAVARARELGLL